MKPLKEADELLIEHFILLSLCRRVLEQDLKALSHSPIRLKDPYVHLIEFALNALKKELGQIKREQEQKKMTIRRASISDTSSEYIIYFQGCSYKMTYLNAHLKYQVEHCIEALFSRFVHHSSVYKIPEF